MQSYVEDSDTTINIENVRAKESSSNLFGTMNCHGNFKGKCQARNHLRLASLVFRTKMPS